MNMHKRRGTGWFDNAVQTDISIEPLLSICGSAGTIPFVCSCAPMEIQENFSGCLGAVQRMFRIGVLKDAIGWMEKHFLERSRMHIYSF